MKISFPFYSGRPPQQSPSKPAELTSILRNRRSPRSYIADQGLIDAVNVALILSQPLLLTGEPGTGKTDLAFSLAYELGYEVFRYETKSTSLAHDLFYTYDTLGRFHDAQIGQRGREARDYVSYNALGLAILRSLKYEDVRQWLPQGILPWDCPNRSVVLIDEVDKAPRDFPNDLLSEFEEMYFKIPEIGLVNDRIAADDKMRPIVVITSNSEKGLPDAFLRRCIYYDIPFPNDPELLTDIVKAHLKSLEDPVNPWLSDAIDFFLELRALRPVLEKKPSTAELLDWLTFLGTRATTPELRRNRSDLLKSCTGILFKTVADRQRANEIVDKWINERSSVA